MFSVETLIKTTHQIQNERLQFLLQSKEKTFFKIEGCQVRAFESRVESLSPELL